MRIFYAFLIIVVALILFMLPTTEAQYDYVTDLETDYFTVITGVGVTSANVTLTTVVYEDDTDTITIASSDSADTPLFDAYNTTTRRLDMTGLSANLTRTITVTYDVYSLSSSGAVDTFVSNLDLFWLLVICAFPIASIASMFLQKRA